MKELHDIKFGNYCKAKYFDNFNELLRINNIDVKTNTLFHQFGNDDILDLSPVPISIELLKRFGFIQQPNRIGSVKYIKITSKGSLFSLSQYNTTYSGIVWRIEDFHITVKHIHQMQNFYKDIYGEILDLL